MNALCDASDRFDPTRTTHIRRAFRAESDRRWAKLRVLTRQAIVEKDLLGLGPVTVEMVSLDCGAAFQEWIKAAAYRLVMDGPWIGQRVGEATALAHHRWAKGLRPRDRSNQLASLARAEMEGVVGAVVQRAVRVVAHGVMNKQRPAAIAAEVAKIIQSIGRDRGRLVAEHAVTLAYAKGSLDAFRAKGHTHVGVMAEHLPRVDAEDAVGWTPSLKGPKSSQLFARTSRATPTAKQMKAIEEAEARLRRQFEGEEVEVLNAGDDLVCQECLDISEDGPYDLDTAESLIPAHNFCRCSFVPASDKRFAHDAFNPDEPRDPSGKWASGGERETWRRERAEGEKGKGKLTERWRNMSRGFTRAVGAKAQAKAGTPERWERRLLAAMPGATFNERGELTNVEEMRKVLAARRPSAR